MNTTKETYALYRVLDLLEENSFGYLATKNQSFGTVVSRLYKDVSKEISRLEQYQAPQR